MSGRPPGRIASVISQQPWFMGATPERRRAVAREVQGAHQRSQNNKARVKAHPDLAERLRRSLGYSRFEQWSGFVPPGHDPDGRPNNSPVRAELVVILREAIRRDSAA